jgi:1,4-alpha-glucan branching enzyme
MNRALLMLLMVTSTAAAPTQFPSQSFSLLPQKTDGGVLFQCYAPEAHVVYLAGDFNGWANNVDGRIASSSFAMSGPDTKGVWRKTVKLDAGVYRFKFNVNGEGNGWFAPDSIDELDGDKNAILHIGATGDVLIPSARNPMWKPRRTARGVLFTCYAPKAHLVYLAGDFNDWANNREGLVFDPQFIMHGPDGDGAWRAEVALKPGRHLYQFVIDGDHWVADANGDETDKDNRSVAEVK